MAEYINLDPQLGEWYLDPQEDLRFQVVAIDEDNDAIEIQYFDGDVDEIDFNAWYAAAYEPAAPPEDYGAPLDRLEEGDAGYTEPNSGEPDSSRRQPHTPR